MGLNHMRCVSEAKVWAILEVGTVGRLDIMVSQHACGGSLPGVRTSTRECVQDYRGRGCGCLFKGHYTCNCGLAACYKRGRQGHYA